jgi:hypothetical protein
MKRVFLLLFLVLASVSSYAQFEQPDRMLSTPKYLPLDDEVGSAPQLNTLLNSFIPDYEITSVDTNNRERTYTFSNASGDKVQVVYTYGVRKGPKVISKITMYGSGKTLVKLYNGYFNTDRKVNDDNVVFQMDKFEYDERIYFALLDPVRDADGRIKSWVVLIKKY